MFRRFRPLHLPGLALALILLVGLGSNVAALVSGDGPRAGGDFSVRALAEGEPTAALGRFLLHHNPLADTLVAVDRAIAWNLVGDLGTRVRQGCPGWLFLTDELELHPDPARALSERVGIVRRVAALLPPPRRSAPPICWSPSRPSTASATTAPIRIGTSGVRAPRRRRSPRRCAAPAWRRRRARPSSASPKASRTSGSAT